MKIRRGRREDLQYLPSILMEAYTGLEEYGEKDINRARKYIEELYQEDPECFFVAEINGEIVGFIFCNRFWYSKFEHGRVGAIHEIVVLPTHRHAGIGKMLIEKAIEVLKPSKIELWVGEKNKKAIEFYEKMGFERKEKAGKWIRMVK
ncbi:GNAT family N-acetyltransferase [Euryarchaeota archaeon ex4484_178]|nr:MAG: GNAT family N-acetyltransferase [Euryarchaeota archaeon ex4484_178]